MISTITCTDIKFACGGCGQRLLVDAEAVGLEIACPTCAQDLQVPEHSDFDPETLLGERGGGHDHGHGAAEAPDDYDLADSPAEAHLLRRQLADAELQNERIERELEAATNQLNLARREAKEHSTARERAAAAAAQRGAELTLLEGELAQREAELAESRERVRVREAELATVRSGRDKFEARVTELREELKVAQDERELSRQLATGLSAQLAARERDTAEGMVSIAALQDRLRSTEGKLVVLEQESAARQLELLALRETAKAKELLESELDEVQGRLTKAEVVGEALSRKREELQSETESLRKQLSESEGGREVLALRERVQTAGEEVARTQRALDLAEVQARKWREAEERSQAGLETLRSRCERAERHAEEGKEAALTRDCEVLRGIVERQKSELSQQHTALAHLRRGQIWLRFAYALIAVVTIGATGMIAYLARHFLEHGL